MMGSAEILEVATARKPVYIVYEVLSVECEWWRGGCR